MISALFNRIIVHKLKRQPCIYWSGAARIWLNTGKLHFRYCEVLKKNKLTTVSLIFIKRIFQLKKNVEIIFYFNIWELIPNAIQTYNNKLQNETKAQPAIYRGDNEMSGFAYLVRSLTVHWTKN